MEPTEPASRQPRYAVERTAADDRHGAISRSDALAAGMTKAQIDRRLRKGQWVRPGPEGWYLLESHANSDLARLFVASSALDGPAWGQSSVALFELAEHPNTPMVASTRRYTGPGARRIHVTGLRQLPTVRINGIESVTAAVAVVAAARWMRSEAELHILIDTAIRNGVTGWREVEAILRRFPRMGRGGSVRMRQVLEDRRVDAAVPLSDWGRRFVVELRDTDLPRPAIEYRVVDDRGCFIAQVDAAYPALRFAIELDSRAFHLSEEAFEVDRQRDADLARAGWLVRRFTWRQWQDQRPWLVRTIRSDLAHRTAVVEHLAS
jgi:hypothetical protein